METLTEIKLPTGYEFNAKRHIHTLDGKPLTGVTTVLGVIAKPALIQWAADMACDCVSEKLNEESLQSALNPAYIRAQIRDVLPLARVAHRKKKEDAAAKGTDVHAIIEGIVKNAIENSFGRILQAIILVERDIPQVAKFLDWANDNHVRFLESEKHIYSREWWVGGICDLVFEINGKVYVGDIKTSSSIYETMFWQTAAYQKCLQEMGLYPNIEGHTIINLKKNGQFDVQNSYGYEENKKAFEAALTIYRIQALGKAALGK